MHGPTDDEVRLGLALGVDDFQRIGIDSPGVSAGPHGPHPRPRGDATAAVLEPTGMRRMDVVRSMTLEARG